jgi:chaperonin GroEL (HSP60 family)
MNDTTEQTPPEPEPLNNEIEVDEEKIFIPQSELPFPEQEIDLNAVFPNEESDLNDLFPDEEIRRLLKKVQRNKKDLHTMTDRFTDEDWGGNALTDDEPTQPSNTED